MSTNRVVVTGYGVTSPIGNTPEEFWNSLHEGKIGIKPITKFDASEIPVFNAGEIQDFPFDKYFVKKDQNRMDTYSLYAIYAAMEAIENSGLNMEEENRDRVGVIVSSGIGGLQELEDQIIRMHERGMKRIQPMFIPKALSNMGAGNIALKIGAQGVCKSVTTACASANDAIGEAFREIKFGMHDVVLAGGAEASITKIGIGGFNALTALSTTEDPERSSIPFDKDRNGFVMGEGAGVLVIESLEHAQKRGANILAEIVGYGSNCDAYHMTTPTPDGSGAAKAIKLAINEAGIKPEDVDYVNAHGTSTPANEKGESGAIVSVLGKEVPVSSTKSFTGHLLGAAGAVEAIATIEAIRHSFVPKTAGTKELSDYIEANVVYGEGQEADIKPEDVDYVNAHGTSTPANEKGESGAIVSVLGKEVPVSSTKSFTGHLLGAAGAVEAIATIEAIRHSFVPKTAGTKELSDYIEANVVYGEGQEADIQYAISNTFGFGGHNAVLAFKRWEG